MDCKVYKKCGGCTYEHNDYENTIRAKEKYLNELLGTKINSITRMDDPFYYRNKVHQAFGSEKKSILLGRYREGTHRIIENEDCLIEDKKAQEICASIKKLVPSFKWQIYDEDSGRGLIRGILIRTGKHSGEILVVIIVADQKIPSKNNFVKALKERHPEITSIIFNVNDRKTCLILGKKDIPGSGKGFIYDTLCGYKFRISPQSFYQVNVEMTEKLYKKAIAVADLKGTETLIDAYCGIGTISLIASSHVRQVYGVESNKEAIKDAIANARLNDVNNVFFTAMDAGEYLTRLTEQKIRPDVIIVDPARSGLDDNAINGIKRSGCMKVIYISCNPEAFKDDLVKLKKKYTVKEIHAFDMFPWTKHVECVVLMCASSKAGKC